MKYFIIIFTLIFGSLFATTSSPINLSKANSIYYKKGQSDYSLLRTLNFDEYGILLSRFTKSKVHLIDVGFKYNKMDAIFRNSNHDNIITKALILNIYSPRIFFLNPIISYEFQDQEFNNSLHYEQDNWANLQSVYQITTYHNQIFSIRSVYKITNRLSLCFGTSMILSEQVESYTKYIFFDGDQSSIISEQESMYEYYSFNLSTYFLLYKNLFFVGDINFHTGHDTKQRDISLSINFQI